MSTEPIRIAERFKLGEHVRVWLNRDALATRVAVKPAAAPDFPKEPFLVGDAVARVGPPRITFYDAATSYAHVDPNVRVGWSLVQGVGTRFNRAGTRDFINGYLETDSEVATPFGPEVRHVESRILANLPVGYSRTVEDSRHVANAWPLYHNCGQLFLDANLYPKDNPTLARRYPLQPGTPAWAKVRPPAERAARLADLEPYFSSPDARRDYADMQTLLARERAEEWLDYEVDLVYEQAARLSPVVGTGQYHLRMTSPFFYEEVDTGDTFNYKVTTEPNYNAEERPMPSITAGRNEAGGARVFLVPQYWRAQGRFKAWYLFVTFWSFTYFVVPFVFQFHNRFPLFPRPFTLGTSDYPPVWFWFERSAAHQRVESAVRAIEFVSIFIACLFVFTSDGIFEIRRVNTFTGALSAVVEIGGRVYYVWRRTPTNRDLTLVIAQGPLQTGFINSWGAELIGGVPGTSGVPLG